MQVRYILCVRLQPEGDSRRIFASKPRKCPRKMLEAINIMQLVGIDYMVENGMEKILLEKGVVTPKQLEDAYPNLIQDENKDVK